MPELAVRFGKIKGIGPHAEQNLHRQARLDEGIAVGLLAAAPVCRCGIPVHLGVESDR